MEKIYRPLGLWNSFSFFFCSWAGNVTCVYVCICLKLSSLLSSSHFHKYSALHHFTWQTWDNMKFRFAFGINAHQVNRWTSAYKGSIFYASVYLDLYKTIKMIRTNSLYMRWYLRWQKNPSFLNECDFKYMCAEKCFAIYVRLVKQRENNIAK